MTEYKLEQQLKERAKRLDLIASKRKPPFHAAAPGWMIIDRRTNAVLAGAEKGFGFELSYSQAEAFIADMEKNADE